ncbi:MAG TPA: hypothetical protein VHM30_14665 [Gemmatimonadaceae bacterium]|nr:hypothetical protein [Gemmatimonadaceae bacterium]
MIRTLGWALRRELWENRWLYLAPLGIAAVLAAGFVGLAFWHPGHVTGAASVAGAQGAAAVVEPYALVAGLMMLVGLLVAAIYCVDALYGERRDRSVLLWKSLPVSDLVTVLAKLCIPVVVLPVIVWGCTVALHFVMLVTSVATVAARGESVALFWSRLHLVPDSFRLLYHLVVLHGLFAAPLYGWLLLVSAWAPRAPFAWAILPPLAIVFVERVVFGTMYFAELLGSRFGGSNTGPAVPGRSLMDAMMPPSMWHALVAPGFWVGLLVAALFVAGTVRVRRSAQPI